MNTSTHNKAIWKINIVLTICGLKVISARRESCITIAQYDFPPELWQRLVDTLDIDDQGYIRDVSVINSLHGLEPGERTTLTRRYKINNRNNWWHILLPVYYGIPSEESE
jgi:hypothetical protein